MSNFNVFGVQDDLKKIIKTKYPNIGLGKKLFEKTSVVENLNNDYNVKFLPETQFLDLNLKKKDFIFNENFNDKHLISKWWYKSFYLEAYEDVIILVELIIHFKMNLYV